MRAVTVRHFTEDDVPLRVALLRDGRFQANLNDRAVVTGDDELTAAQLATLRDGQDDERVYTACGRDGQPIGFLWITTIDWRSRTCELSIAMLPRYRLSSYGPVALRVIQEHLHDELGMRVIVNQVLAHNTMLHSATALAANRTVECAHDSWTVGEWRTACYWSQTAEAFHAGVAEWERRRATTAARIAAAVTS